MNERVHVSEVGFAFRRLWWIVVLLSAVGAAVGLTAAQNVPPIYRSTATALVGPTDGAVTRTSTIRASEDLAAFYADMARRELVLGPVADTVGIANWFDLRNRVSAKVPEENLRLISVSVMGPTQFETRVLANAIVKQVVSLSPAAKGTGDQAFVNEQAQRLKKRITESQSSLDQLRKELGQTSDPNLTSGLRDQIAREAEMLDSWQRTYVEFLAAEPQSDAGGLQVLDPASPSPERDRSGTIRLTLVGGAAGALLGLLVAWLWHRRSVRRSPRGHDTKPSATRTPTPPPSRPIRPLSQPGRGAGAPRGPRRRQPVATGAGGRR